MKKKPRIVRPDIRTQWLGTVDEGKHLEIFGEIDGLVHSLATIVADVADESLWFEVCVNDTIVQIPLETVRQAVAAAPGEVHSESWYEANVYPRNKDT